MKYRLENEWLTVTVSSLGAEILSVQARDGLEYIWQGDPAYWRGHAPMMFPICGRLREDCARLEDGRLVRLPRHGLARISLFTYRQASAQELVLSLLGDEESYEAYPFPFRLVVTYRLEGRQLLVDYRVENLGEEPLPFCIGSHPAFRYPLLAGEKAESYRLLFEEPEEISAPACLENGLIDGQKRQLLAQDCQEFAFHDSLNDVGCIVLDQLASRKIRLLGEGQRGVEMAFSDFPYAVLWTAAPQAPMVAIEPCTGLATFTDESDAFVDKRGMRLLGAGEKSQYQYELTFF